MDSQLAEACGIHSSLVTACRWMKFCQDFTLLNCTFYIHTYRQYMHEVFHSFPPTSPSRVTIWWGVTICSEWWRWLSHVTPHALILAWNLRIEHASSRSSLTHTYTHTYTQAVLASHIPSYILLHTGMSIMQHILYGRELDFCTIIIIIMCTTLYVNMYVCIYSCILYIANYSLLGNVFCKAWVAR